MGSLGEAVLDLTVDPSKIDKGLGEGKGKITGSLDGMKSQLSTFSVAAGTMMGNMAYSAISSIGSAIVSSIKGTMDEYMSYANQVRDTTRSLGVGAEEASRLIQVADDVTISYESLSVAMKMAQKNGIDPSVEGLAKLSDQYLQLAPGVERTQFLLDTFGKSGAEMGKMMEKGGEGIREMSAGIEDNMIMTQKALDAQRQYEIGVDALSDAWRGLTYEVMPPLIEGANSVITTLRDWSATAAVLGERGIELQDMTLGNVAGAFQEAVAQRGAADSIAATSDANKDATGTFEASTSAIGDNKAAVDAAGQAYDDFKDKIDQISKSNQEAERFIQNYSTSQQTYVKNHAKAIEDQAKAQRDLNKLRADGGSSEAIIKASDNLKNAGKAIKELEAEWHKSTQAMVYDMVMAKVSVDGLTDAEFNATQDLAVQMGVRTQAEADQAKQMMATATAYAAGIASQENVMRENKANADELARLEAAKQTAIGSTTNAAVAGAENAASAQVSSTNTTTAVVQSASQTQAQSMSAVTNATMSEVDAQKKLQTTVMQTVAQYTRLRGVAGGISGAKISGGKSPDERDSGGSGKAGTPYMIGTGAQPELFIPDVDGTFIPNADAKTMMKNAFADLGSISGAGFSQGYEKSASSLKRASSGAGQTTSCTSSTNVTINNPMPEPASASVEKSLKKMSYLGVVK